ncbi:MAG: ATP synthase F1 subunit gamma [Verrucomicrobiales bacterium]|nr:ATP synthase F1 subunit gamma [Verrucomicrobiales bacterium]
MANLRDIRRRIKSIKNTAQITRAMQLVAASKMKRAQDQAISGRAYAELLNKVLVNLKEQADEESHPLLQEPTGGRELIILVTTDKGLCGPLNTNLLRLIGETAPADALYVTVGSKGRQYLTRMKRDLVADFPVKDPVDFAETKRVSKFAMEKFLEGGVSRVRVAFTNFVNTIKQEPLIETLLPISPIDLGRDKGFVGMGSDLQPGAPAQAGAPAGGGYLFEPSTRAVLDTVVPQYVNNQLYQMVLESRASEHSSRMVAMKSATDNAKQIIKDLTLDYNKQRQAAITSELLEITTAMKALE